MSDGSSSSRRSPSSRNSGPMVESASITRMTSRASLAGSRRRSCWFRAPAFFSVLPTVSTTSTPCSRATCDGGVGAVVGDDEHPVRWSGLLLQGAQRVAEDELLVVRGEQHRAPHCLHRARGGRQRRRGPLGCGHHRVRGQGSRARDADPQDVGLLLRQRPVRGQHPHRRGGLERRDPHVGGDHPGGTGGGEPELPLGVVEEQHVVRARLELLRDERPHPRAKDQQRDGRQDGRAPPQLRRPVPPAVPGSARPLRPPLVVCRPHSSLRPATTASRAARQATGACAAARGTSRRCRARAARAARTAPRPGRRAAGRRRR